MALSVVMPALEMAQETGKLVRWLKREGETVTKGEMLLEIETDKAVVEIEAQSDGILAGISANVDDVVPVGQTIAWLVQPGEQPPASSGTAQTGRKMDVRAAAAGVAPVATGEAAPVAGARISPKARRLAREHGVDINSLQGSGPSGEILAEDILKIAGGPAEAGHYGSQAGVASGVSRTIEPSSIGRIMAERTTQSWTTIPHFFVARDVDTTSLNARRETLIPEIERSHGVKVTHTDLIVAAVARGLRQHPRMNASWADGSIAIHAEINVALAMAVENAVVTAVIRNADRASVGDLAKQRQELAERARANRLQPTDITGATFTISNLGMFGVDAFTAIIVPPQAGILAVGASKDRVVAVDGLIGVRPMMTITLSSDHRVVDGASVARFLNDVVANLQTGEP
jgi:pyruvate dehydrogenase E2 component (dihydrolipoamide acetyltransferase)